MLRSRRREWVYDKGVVMGNNTKNLKPLNTLNKEVAKEICKKGQKASAEVKRKRKTLKEAYLSIASKPYVPIGDMAESITQRFGSVTVDEAIILAMTVKASNGDVQAAVYLRDTIGEKPTDNHEINIDMNNPFKDLTVKELKELAAK